MTVLESAPRVERTRTRLGLLLTVILAGQFMAILDASIVNVAAPTIRRDLHASGAGLQMIIAGYIIAYAMLLITGARLGDVLGYRRMFQSGLVMFTIASLACGLATVTWELITFRFVQGAGAAMMVPQVMSLIQRNFAGKARARAISLYSTVIAGAVVVGQVLGGVLVSADLVGGAWRPVFMVNVPIGVALLIVGSRLLPPDEDRRQRGLDLTGLVTLSATVVLLVVPLVLGHEEHWPLWGWICLAASVLVFVVFVAIERRAVAPLMPGRLLRARGMVPAMAAIFMLMIGYAGFMFTVALHMQTGLGYSPLRAGLNFVPVCIGFGLTSLNWQRLPARLHRPMIPVGVFVAALGFAGTGVFQHGAGFLLVTAVFGLAQGLAFGPLITSALKYVPIADAGEASGLLVTVNQLGQVVGVATLGSLFLSLVNAHGTSHAMAVTCVVLAIVQSAAAATTLLLSRDR